ncbi:MAG: transposase [Pseudomonadales bacterium]
MIDSTIRRRAPVGIPSTGADVRVYHAELVQPVGPAGGGFAVRRRSRCDSFAGIELAEDKIPDESTILRFRHLPTAVRPRRSSTRCSLLEEQHLLVKSGDHRRCHGHCRATFDENAKQARDPEMRPGKKGKSGISG